MGSGFQKISGSGLLGIEIFGVGIGISTIFGIEIEIEKCSG
jgi:hypothetical protein